MGKWSNLTNILGMGWNHQPVLSVFEHFNSRNAILLYILFAAKIDLYAWAESLQQTHPCSANEDWQRKVGGSKFSATSLTFWQITISVQVYRRCLTIVGRCNLNIMNPYDSPSFRTNKKSSLWRWKSPQELGYERVGSIKALWTLKGNSNYIFSFAISKKRQDVSETRLIMWSVVFVFLFPTSSHVHSVRRWDTFGGQKVERIFPKTRGRFAKFLFFGEAYVNSWVFIPLPGKKISQTIFRDMIQNESTDFSA